MLAGAMTQMWMSVISITEAAVHTLTVPTHLETLPVPVLEDISATESTAQVTTRKTKLQEPIYMYQVCKSLLTIMLLKQCCRIRWCDLRSGVLVV